MHKYGIFDHNVANRVNISPKLPLAKELTEMMYLVSDVTNHRRNSATPVQNLFYQ